MIHNSYQEYYEDIITIYELSFALSNIDDNDDVFQSAFRSNLLDKIKICWNEYETKQRDHYQLTEEELDTVLQNTTYDVAFKSLTKLSNLGLLEAFIKSNGEISYSLTEKGKQVANSLNNYL